MFLAIPFFPYLSIYLLYRHLQHHNDTINKQTQEDFFINIFTSHFIVRVRKGLLKVCVWEGVGDRTETAIFWPPLLWPSTLCLSRSPDVQPEDQRPTLLGDGFLYCILSASSPDTNSSRPQTPSAWCGFPYHTSSITPSPTVTGTVWLLSWLSYIIVQRTLSRLIDFWNRMLDRHQAEITLMQFTSHSHPVHQSMSVPWEFFYLVPFHQPISAHAISSYNCH